MTSAAPIKEAKIQTPICIIYNLPLIPTCREVTTQPQLSHYLDNLEAITSNDGKDSHGDNRQTVTWMAGDEVDKRTWGTVIALFLMLNYCAVTYK